MNGRRSTVPAFDRLTPDGRGFGPFLHLLKRFSLAHQGFAIIFAHRLRRIARAEIDRLRLAFGNPNHCNRFVCICDRVFGFTDFQRCEGAIGEKDDDERMAFW